MSFLTDCIKCFAGSVYLLILLSFGIGLSITSIVLGSININSNCTGYSQIPSYLISIGVIGVVMFLVKISDNLNKKEDEEKKDSCFVNLLYLAQLGVLIWGSVILFGKPKPDCDRVLFDYAFAITITPYAFFVFYLLIACCYACSDLKDDKNQNTNNKDVVIDMDVKSESTA
jgi:hypothetical protein